MPRRKAISRIGKDDFSRVSLKERGRRDDSVHKVDFAITDDEVLEAVFAGESSSAITGLLQQLSGKDRQVVLCTVCALHNDIACICVQHGVEVIALLSAECPLFLDGHATCLTGSAFCILDQPEAVIK